MKTILIIILGLMSVAYGQTVGQFRYDTTKFLKVGGSNEVKFQNSTRATIGGVMLNTSTDGWGKWVAPSNGLTGSATALKWGGDLTGNTIINIDTDSVFYDVTAGQFVIRSDDVGAVVMGFRKDTDVANRLQIQADGHLEWGDGTGVIDVGITRVSDGILSMSGNLQNTRLHITASILDSAILSLGISDSVVKSQMYYDNVNSRFGIITGGNLYVSALNTAVGNKALRYNTSTKQITLADTTAAGGGSQTPWTSNINADGFTLFGNDGSGETLTLGSTSHATKGKILFGTSAYDEVNNRLGIGNASPSYDIHINKTVNGLVAFNVENQSSGTLGRSALFLTRSLGADYYGAIEYANENSVVYTPLSLNFYTPGASTGGMFFSNIASAPINFSTNNTTRLTIAGGGDATFAGSKVSLKHLAGTSTTPGIAGGTGSGTAPTVSIAGTDLAGEITITTDTDPATSSVFCTITFNAAFGTAPYVVITPSNDAAALLSGNGGDSRTIYVNSTTTTFTINTNSAKEPLASTQYKFHYHVIQ